MMNNRRDTINRVSTQINAINNIRNKKMDRKYYLASLFVCVLMEIPSHVFGQTYHCGTALSPEQVLLETSEVTIAEGKPTESLPLLNRTLSISVFIVKNKILPDFSTPLVNTAVNSLNGYFTSIGLTFRICSIDTVENYQFDDLDMNDNEKDLLIQNSKPNTINLYLVSTLTDTKDSYATGHTFMPGDIGKNSIFIRKSLIQGTELVHQMGHFLGLYHTYETQFGAELVNGSNCTIAGDRCCDTPAEPLISTYSNCIYTGTEKDKNGKLYSPSPKNMMTLGDNCRCVFSKTQLLRMAHMLQTYRKDLR
jgi:hypothetical protein